MASRVPLIFLSSLLILLFGYSAAAKSSVPQIPIKYDTVFLNRSSFPAGFVFGTASSAYQYEGAWKAGGKGLSNWDNYTHQHPERITNSSYGTNADVTNDEYHRYKEDVQIMKKMNTDAYRFSISWSRLLPNGKLSGGVNKDGVVYYNNLIKELLANGLKPFVTIFHWDVPQALEEEFGGFLSPKIVPYYKDYAELCFKLFGDRVKHWITLNEPYIFSLSGYAMGTFAPGRCSAWQNLNCTGGDSGTEPYLVGHHLLLSHAAAVRVYKKKYQKVQNGVIGITLISHWYVPLSNATHHQNAAKRALDFMFGWFMDPLTKGDYPHVMRSLVRKRLPVFTKYESELLTGSFDFIGINYYTTYYSAYGRNDNPLQPSMLTDPHTNITSDRNGVPIGPQGGSGWLNIYPKGIRDLLVYTKKKYNNPLIYITENGVDQADHDDLSLEKALIDNQRIEYYFSHLNYLWKAIKEGVNVKGYFAWSLLDNFEWSSGYTSRFGINYVDYKNGQKRYPKLSAHWFTKFLKN